MLLKKYKKIVGLSVLGALLLPVFASAANLGVVFEATPLFSEINFLPGSSVTRSATVTNNTQVTQDIITEATKVTDTGGLGAVLTLKIADAAGSLYEGKLSDFLRGGEVLLLPLTRASSKTYLFTISFDSDTPNAVQNAALGFDLCIGFKGGTRNCGDTAISSEHTTEDGSTSESGGTLPGTSSGGGGFVADPQPPGSLVLLSIQAYAGGDLTPDMVRIVWDTNFLSTSQVVYGIASGGLYSIDLSSPTFGYPSATAKDPTKVTHHSVDISGLIPGETYLYRAISTASPPTVSFEQQFTVPKANGTGGGESNISSIVTSQTTVEHGVTLLATREPSFGVVAQEMGSRGKTQPQVGSGEKSVDEEGSPVATDVSSAPRTVASEPVSVPVEENGNANSLAAVVFNTFLKSNTWLVVVGVVLFLALVVLSRRKKPQY